MTKEQKLQRFLVKFAEKESKEQDIEENLSHAVHIVERELKVFIDEEYPLIKFWNQYEEIKWYREEEKRKYDEEESHQRLKTLGR